MRSWLVVILSVFLISGGGNQVAYSLGHSPDGHVHELCEGIAPENDLYIPDTGLALSGISEAVFHAVLDRIEEIFVPMVASMGKTLRVQRNWEDGTVNAYARQYGNTFEIAMFGGLARHEVTTPMAFAAVACHEMGHHLAGYPRKVNNTRWASTEGQSDYYATLKCMRLFMDGLTQEQMSLFKMDTTRIHPTAQLMCDFTYVDYYDKAVCAQNAMAGKVLADLLGDLQGVGATDFNKRHPEVVPQTDDRHPHAQCRQDTYFAGALCVESVGNDLDMNDPIPGACNRVEGDSVGVRPLCWYKPPM